MRGHPSQDRRAPDLYTPSKNERPRESREKDEPQGAWGAITSSSYKLVITSITVPNFNQAVCIFSCAAFINGGINDTFLQHKYDGGWQLGVVQE